MRRGAVVLMMLGLLIAGCGRTPFPTIEAKLDGFKGKSIKSVTDALGPPDQKADVGDETSYQWNLTRNFGAAYNLVAFRCDIMVYAGRDGNISRYSYDGNNAGCSRYAIKLDQDYHFVKGVLD